MKKTVKFEDDQKARAVSCLSPNELFVLPGQPDEVFMVTGAHYGIVGARSLSTGKANDLLGHVRVLPVEICEAHFVVRTK